MTETPNVQSFLENIMRIQVTYMGGATAGILGSSDANDDIVNSLKKISVDFARDYQNRELSSVELAAMADQITGYLQTLQITNTLSVNKSEELIVQLDTLMSEASA